MVAGLLLVGDFALDNPYDPTPSGPTRLGAANDVVELFTVRGVRPRSLGASSTPAHDPIGARSTVAAVAMAIAYVVLSILLVAGVMTFQQQINR